MNYVIGGLFVAGSLLWHDEAGSPHALRWLVIGLLACVLVLCNYGRRLPRDVGYAVLAIFTWCVLSLLWSSDPAQGALSLVSVGSLAFLVWGMGTVRNIVPSAVTIAFAGALLLLVLFPGPYGGFGNENWAAEWILIALPYVVLFTYRHWKMVYGLHLMCVPAFGIGYLVFVNPSNSWMLVAWVCLMAYCVKRRWWYATAFATVIPVDAPFLWPALWERLVGSLLPRVEIWINTLAMWFDAPLFGHGMGSFAYQYGRFQETHIDWLPGLDTRLHPVSSFIFAAHNEPLQGLAELGLVGVILAGVCLWRIVRFTAEGGVCIAARWSLLITAALCLVSFPLQNPATAILIATSLGVLVQVHGQVRVKIARVAFACLVCGLVWVNGASLLSSRAYAAGRIVMLSSPGPGWAAIWNAHELQPWDRNVRRELALALTVRGRVGYVPPEAADRVHEIAMSAAPYDPMPRAARLEYLFRSGRWRDESVELRGHLRYLRQHARLQPVTWFFEAHYALRLGDIDHARRAVEVGLTTHGSGLEMAQLQVLKERL